MKNSKPRTVLKPIRIPEKVVKEIEQEASSKNTTFSDIANYRLQHHQNPLTPELLAKMYIPHRLPTLHGTFAHSFRYCPRMCPKG